MSSTIWRCWVIQGTEGEVKAVNLDKTFKEAAVLEVVEQLVLNRYNYFRKSIPK